MKFWQEEKILKIREAKWSKEGDKKKEEGGEQETTDPKLDPRR